MNDIENVMRIRIADIDSHVLCDLFPGCSACVYWECPEGFRKIAAEEAIRLKSEWFEAMATQFNPCGKLLYVDEEPAAYCQYAPPQYVPGISGYPKLAHHIDRDGVMITCLCVSEQYQRKGLGRRLLQEVIEDLKDRGVKSLGTFTRDDSADNCSGPTQFYLAQGFTVVVTESFPKQVLLSLVRLDLGE